MPLFEIHFKLAWSILRTKRLIKLQKKSLW